MKNISVILHCKEAVQASLDFSVLALGVPYKNRNASLKLLKQITMGEISKHDSMLEHIEFHFMIDGISRLCLHHLERHRIASMTVESTRYCKEVAWTYPEVHSDIPVDIDSAVRGILSAHYAESERVYEEILKLTNSKDIAKYALPEGRSTVLAWTINLRSLLNFLKLRETDNHGKPHPEIKRVAKLVRAEVSTIPDIKFMLEGVEL